MDKPDDGQHVLGLRIIADEGVAQDGAALIGQGKLVGRLIRLGTLPAGKAITPADLQRLADAPMSATAAVKAATQAEPAKVCAWCAAVGDWVWTNTRGRPVCDTCMDTAEF